MKKILVQLSKLLSVRMLAIGLTFVQTIVLTRVLGGELFGLLTFALSMSAILMLVLSLGLDQVMMRDIARIGPDRVGATPRWRDDWRLLRRVVAPLTLAVSAIGLVLCFGSDLFGIYSPTVAVGFAMLPLVMARKYVESIVLGTKAVVRSILGSQIAYPVLMILGAGIIWLWGTLPGAVVISWVYVAATMGSLVLSLMLGRLIFRRLSGGGSAGAPHGAGQADKGESPGQSAILKSSGHFALVSLGFVMGQHVDVLLTGVFAGPEEVSIVRIASRVAELAALMRAIVVLQYKPQLAEAHGQGDMAKLQSLVSTMALIFVVTGLPLTLGLWVYAEQVMSVFGPEFVDGAWPMRIYVLGIFFTLVCGPCTVLLSMAGQERIASRIVWIALGINIVFDLILIPLYGPLGCAIANFLSLCFIGVASVLADHRILKIYPTILAAARRHWRRA